MNERATSKRASSKRRNLWILGVLACTILCPLGGLLYLALRSISTAWTDEGCSPDPRIALFTPTEGPYAGRKLTVRPADETDDAIRWVSSEGRAAAAKPEIDPDFVFHYTGLQFRLATLSEVQALGLPYRRSFRSEWSAGAVTVSVGGNRISVREQRVGNDVGAVYTVEGGKPHFLNTHVYSSSGCR